MVPPVRADEDMNLEFDLERLINDTLTSSRRGQLNRSHTGILVGLYVFSDFNCLIVKHDLLYNAVSIEVSISFLFEPVHVPYMNTITHPFWCLRR